MRNRTNQTSALPSEIGVQLMLFDQYHCNRLHLPPPPPPRGDHQSQTHSVWTGSSSEFYPDSQLTEPVNFRHIARFHQTTASHRFVDELMNHWSTHRHSDQFFLKCFVSKKEPDPECVIQTTQMINRLSLSLSLSLSLPLSLFYWAEPYANERRTHSKALNFKF